MQTSQIDMTEQAQSIRLLKQINRQQADQIKQLLQANAQLVDTNCQLTQALLLNDLPDDAGQAPATYLD